MRGCFNGLEVLNSYYFVLFAYVIIVIEAEKDHYRLFLSILPAHSPPDIMID